MTLSDLERQDASKPVSDGSPYVRSNNLTNSDQIRRVRRWSGQARSRPKGMDPNAPQFLGYSLFIPAPFDVERPIWRSNTRRREGRVFMGQPRLVPRGRGKEYRITTALILTIPSLLGLLQYWCQ